MSLHLDDHNWIEPRVRRVTAESPYTTKDRWVMGGNSLSFANYNLGGSDYRHGDSSLFIVLDDSRTRVSSIQFSRHVRLNAQTGKTFHYNLNHPNYGDSSFTREMPLPHEIRPLDHNSLLKCKIITVEALAGDQSNLDRHDKSLIAEAVKIINSKLALFGIEKIK